MTDCSSLTSCCSPVPLALIDYALGGLVVSHSDGIYVRIHNTKTNSQDLFNNVLLYRLINLPSAKAGSGYDSFIK